MPQTRTIQVLIANDEALVREGLATIINRQKEMKLVDQAGNISEVMDAFRLHTPDDLLIDLRLGGLDGLEVIQRVRESYPSIAILIVSSFEGSEDIYRALRAGVRGYLMRGASDSEIIEAIRSLSAGLRYIPDEIANRVAERMAGSTLTPRELQVLQLILKGKNNKDIADLMNITEGTVKFHITAILSKLGVTDRTQAAMAAFLRGIIHPQDL
jgi:two-component system, NarL family, response regulator